MYKDKEHSYEMYMTYHEDESGGQPLPGESGRFACREDGRIDFFPKKLYSEVDENTFYWVETLYCNFDPKGMIGKEVYVLVVRYRTGDTFGHSTGQWFVEGAYLDGDKAREVAELINNDKYKGNKPWNGYFERLENVELHKFTLQGKLYGNDRGNNDTNGDLTFFDHS